MGSNTSKIHHRESLKTNRRTSAPSVISDIKESYLRSVSGGFGSLTQDHHDTGIVLTENQCCGLSDEEVRLFCHPRPFPHSSINQDTSDNVSPNITTHPKYKQEQFHPRPFPSSSLPLDVSGLPDLLDNLCEIECSSMECSTSCRSQTPSTLSCISHLTESTEALDATTATPLSETASDSESAFSLLDQSMSLSDRYSFSVEEWSDRIPPPPPLPPPIAPPPPPLPPTLHCLSSNLSKPAHQLPHLADHYDVFPAPKRKMKKLNWSKVATSSFDKSFWHDLSSGYDLSALVDYEDLERNFCQQQTTSRISNKRSSEGRKERLVQCPNTVQLLDSKRSLSVGVALKQLRLGTPLIVETLRRGQRGSFTVEQLRALKRIMPEKSEIERVRNYSGSFQLLGNAEKYYLLISELPAYQLRVELMLQELELETTMDTISAQLNVIVRTGDEILSSESLRNFLRLILQIGNYLNAGSYAGNAVGFRLSSLSKLAETRANNSTGLTLLHYVVQLACRERAPLLDFVEELTTLRNAARVSMETVVADIFALTETFNQLKSSLQHAPIELRLKSKEFVCNAERCVNELTQRLSEVKRLQWRLTRHFGEDETNFSIEHCMKILANLVDQIRRAQRENCIRLEEQLRSQHSSKPSTINHSHITVTDYAKLPQQRTSFNSGWASPSSSSGPEDDLTESVLGWVRKSRNGRGAVERVHSRRRRVRRAETMYLPVRERSSLELP